MIQTFIQRQIDTDQKHGVAKLMEGGDAASRIGRRARTARSRGVAMILQMLRCRATAHVE
jgi:hypothetical protein